MLRVLATSPDHLMLSSPMRKSRRDPDTTKVLRRSTLPARHTSGRNSSLLSTYCDNFTKVARLPSSFQYDLTWANPRCRLLTHFITEVQRYLNSAPEFHEI